jgi:hypothetical protein
VDGELGPGGEVAAHLVLLEAKLGFVG